MVIWDVETECSLCKNRWVLYLGGQFFCVEHAFLFELLNAEEESAWMEAEENVERMVHV